MASACCSARTPIFNSWVSAFCHGLRDGGMAAVAKHFPGHGAVVADSHEQLPVDRRAYGDLLDDMRPYEKLISNRQLAGVMLAHVVYAEGDPLPAGFSPYWINDQLRSQLGYDGAVFCDDLSMKATRKFGSMASRARLALEAGCDGVISSGLEVPKLREQVDNKLLVITPGIRPVDNKPAGDQKRVVTVETAFSNGADYIVIGRPIRDAQSPRAAAEAVQESIAAQVG